MRLMRLSNAFFLFLILISALQAFAQTAAEAHRKILQSLENRDYQTASVELENLKNRDKKIFEINNYDYLLARVAEKKSDAATAAANYQAVAGRNSVLKEYALWHLAQIARTSGNLLLERTLLQELLTFAPESLMADAARIRFARSLFESKNFDAAISAFNNLQASLGSQKTSNNQTPLEKTPRYRENLVFLGEAYLQSGKQTEARDAFTKLINNLPNPSQPDDFALAGARGLDRLETGENFGKLAPNLTDLNHLQRAAIYQFNRDFADARLHYQAIIKNYPQSGLVAEALYQTGRGYVQEGNFLEAINWFERVLEQFPDHPAAKDALTQAASAYARVGKPKEAVKRYQRFIEKYADADNLDRAYLNIIDVLRDTGADSDALKWTAKTQEVFRGKLPETLALFAQTRIRIAQNDWENALADAEKLLTFNDLGGTRVPGGTNKAEITFLKALILENLQRYAEAIDVYLSIPDGRSEYYGWRATERLQAMSNNEKSKMFVEEKINSLTGNDLQNKIDSKDSVSIGKAQNLLRLTTDEVNKDLRRYLLRNLEAAYLNSAVSASQNFKIPNFKLLEFGRREVLKEKPTVSDNYHQSLADELLFLGLYDEGTPELETTLKDKPKSDDLNYTLAVFYKRGDMANRATAFIEPLWRNVPADYQIELIPRDQAELLYPAPYVDSLLQFATPRGVDPRFALAIMRQESRFRADVKSVAAARGLMQFISTTSNQIAKELGKENFRQDELYNPPTAVLFGSQYLANLFKQFPDQPAAVAASYNGGEDNVRRWILRSKTEIPDRYVPEIVFSQSKDYAYKVMANYRAYQIFYDENLKLR